MAAVTGTTTFCPRTADSGCELIKWAAHVRAACARLLLPSARRRITVLTWRERIGGAEACEQPMVLESRKCGAWDMVLVLRLTAAATTL